jgi:hypothetical protein
LQNGTHAKTREGLVFYQKDSNRSRHKMQRGSSRSGGSENDK